jgi:hypothetical protein
MCNVLTAVKLSGQFDVILRSMNQTLCHILSQTAQSNTKNANDFCYTQQGTLDGLTQ